MKGQPANLRSALVSVDPKTGAILAYYGGDNGVGTDYAQAMRRPGSAFKPFVLSAALQDARQSVGLGSVYDGSSPQNFLGVDVDNSDGFSCDQCTVATAMTNSVNTVFYKMGIDTGPARVVDAAHQAGIPADELPNPTADIALGDKEVRPIDMAAAFATFAADGIRHDPYVVNKVTAADGRVLYDHGDLTRAAGGAPASGAQRHRVDEGRARVRRHRARRRGAPGGLIMIAPVSVCHHVSTTGARSPPITRAVPHPRLGVDRLADRSQQPQGGEVRAAPGSPRPTS